MSDGEIFGQLLHGTARAWRQKLDARLKPMGLSQAKWRTLMHLSLAEDALTQAEIAGRLGVEEPTVVTLLNRLEKEGWVTRKNSARDRRCKMVLLGRRAQRVIEQINAAAANLRHELLAGIRREDLQTCINILRMIGVRAAKDEKERRATVQAVNSNDNGHNRDRYPFRTKGTLVTARRKST
jgi:MarR family transcriptional regulator for hemolysin